LALAGENSVKKLRRFIVLAAVLAGGSAFAGGQDACLGCHETSDFKGVSADAIATAVKDAGIRPHKKFSDLSDAEIQAIADVLAGVPAGG
jgi:cytochrome c553